MPTLQPYLVLAEFGDVFYPGLLLCLLNRFDAQVKLPWYQGYFLNGLLGFMLGMEISFIVPIIWPTIMQCPPLVTVLPCVLIPTFCLAYIREETQLLFLQSQGRSQLLKDLTEDDKPIRIELEI
jgi:hypothetical protein